MHRGSCLHAAKGRPRPRRGRRVRAGRRGDRRGRGVRRRERHYRRERAGHTRERRRSKRGHRRHPRALRLARLPGHDQPGRDVPRPDDCDGRRSQASENPQRDRARHPARGPHDHLPSRDGDASPVLDVQRRGGQAGHARDHHRPRRAPRVPDSDDHRWPAFGHRHRRHGPDDPGEHHRHVRPRGRGRGRRRRAPPRQDRDDHAGQPPGDGVSASTGVHDGAARRHRAAQLPGRRDARGPEHRRPGQGAVRHSRARRSRPEGRVRAVHGAHANERREPRRPRDPQGRGGRHRGLRQGEGGRVSCGRPQRRRLHLEARRHAARRRRGFARPRRGAAQGHRQGWHQGAFRRAAPHGDQDGR